MGQISYNYSSSPQCGHMKWRQGYILGTQLLDQDRNRALYLDTTVGNTSCTVRWHIYILSKLMALFTLPSFHSKYQMRILLNRIPLLPNNKQCSFICTCYLNLSIQEVKDIHTTKIALVIREHSLSDSCSLLGS